MPHTDARQSVAPDLVLHIGTGKTGTTSLQSFLGYNRQPLADRGVLYPRTPGRSRHVRLGLYIKDDAELEGIPSWHRQPQSSPAEFRGSFERKLLDEINGSELPRVLLSDEALYGCSARSLEALRGLTDRIAGRLRLVVYLRRQDDHLCSRYQQVVKTGEVRRLADRVQELDLSSTYDYHSRLRTWQRILNPAEFVVRRFDRRHFVAGSLHQDFLAAAGLDVQVDGLRQVDRRNESLDAEAVEFLRILNIYRVQREGGQPGLINNRPLVRRLAETATGPTLTLPDSWLDGFMSKWEASNRAVVREFLDDSSGELFDSPRKTRHTTTRQHLDPARLDHFLALVDLPEPIHAPLRRLVDQEALEGARPAAVATHP